MLQQKIRDDMLAAMKAKEQLKLDTLRMLITAMTNEMKAKGGALVDGMLDEDVVALIRREVKKRREASEAFTGGGRLQLAAKEDEERAVLETYLPALMSENDVRAAVLKKKEDLGITEKKDAGILMGRVMKDLQGKADGALVKKIVYALWT